MKVIIVYKEVYLNGKGGIETVLRNLQKIASKFSCDLQLEIICLNNCSEDFDFRNCGDARVNYIYSDIDNLKCLSDYFLKVKPMKILCLDPLSCYLSSLAAKKITYNCQILSWMHSSLYGRKWSNLIFLNYAHNHLAISTKIASQLVDLGINRKNVYIIYNPVMRSHITIPTSKNKINFLYIGRVSAYGAKNMHELFNALSFIEGDWNLHILGDGGDVNILKDLSNKLKISHRIIWHGWCNSPWEYIHNEIRSVSCLVISSKYEGFGMVIAEAISHGIFCISSNCDCGPSDIINKDNGLLYNVGDIHSLFTNLKRITLGEVSIEPNKIKKTINHLYEENFITRFVIALSK